MEVVYFLLPLSLVLSAFFIYSFVRSVKTGQYDDLESPAQKVLIDDEPLNIKKEKV
jgi:cbb3-type cytochrome oxidase maturation protein